MDTRVQEIGSSNPSARYYLDGKFSILNGHPQAIFHLFSFFSNILLNQTVDLRRDPNSDRWSQRLAR